MKIECHCGTLVVDQTDDLPHKAHLIPDQAWNAISDAIDDQVIDALDGGHIDRETAYHQARQIIGRSARMMWQCRSCGRLYLDDQRHQLQCYVPADGETAREVLRGNS